MYHRRKGNCKCIHISQIKSAHVATFMQQQLYCHNNVSSLNATSNCHTNSWGYKYKLLMHYREVVEDCCSDFHLPY